MTSMKTAVVLNKSARGLFIGKEYIAPNCLARVDSENEFLHELVKRGTVSIIDSPAKVGASVATDDVPSATETASDADGDAQASTESVVDQENVADSVSPRRISSSKPNRS